MDFSIKTDLFQGPLEKLLELVESQKLDINLISLSQVTSDFLDYLKTLEHQEAPSSLIADFLVVASKLLLIKSKMMLPLLKLEEEEEEDIQLLQLQLKFYKEIKSAANLIKENWREKPAIATREFLMGKKSVFFPPTNISLSRMDQVMGKIIKLIKRYQPVEFIKNSTVKVEEKIKDILAKIKNASFRINKSSAKNKSELVALFLAVLHLVRHQSVKAVQAKPFEDIEIKRIEFDN